ncbi:MAG: ectonucleotide pyrophosphatase/phosphodiesterase [Fidelibacterota bacterium]
MTTKKPGHHQRSLLRILTAVFFNTVILFSAPPYVLLVSFDGFRADYLDWYSTPNFHRMAAGGVQAEGLTPVFVTKTFPNHYSIATGMYVEHHGLVGNEFFAPDLNTFYQISDRTKVEDGRFYGGEPIWVTAEKQGIKTASYFWVGSEAAIQGIQPSIWKRYRGSDPFEARIDSVAAWFQLPAERRPHLVMLYFNEPDDTGHRFSPRSPQTAAEIQSLDQLLNRLLMKMDSLTIADSLNIILVSDHGMAEISPERQIHLDQLINLDGLKLEGGNPYVFIYGASEDRLDSIYKQLRSVPHLKTYKKADIPDRWHFRENNRIKQLLVLADEGWSLFWNPRQKLEQVGGAHGFDNALRSMAGLFVADGPAFKDGYRRPAFENVNIYPLITYILGLTPNPEIDGELYRVQDLLRKELLKGQKTNPGGQIQPR